MSAITPLEISSNIGTVSATFDQLQNHAEQLTVADGGLLYVGLGNISHIISGYKEATQILSELNSRTMTPYSSGSDANLIFNSFRELVRVHQRLLKILTGKNDLFVPQSYNSQSVAAVLRDFQSKFDTFTNGIMNTVASREKDIRSEADTFSGVLDAAIEQLSPESGLSLA